MSVKIMTKGDQKPRMMDGCAYITVEADEVQELYGLEAKRLAYDHRFKMGMANAGIEAWSSPAAVEGTKTKKQKFFRVFRLTPGL
jgi:hypothetical protein